MKRKRNCSNCCYSYKPDTKNRPWQTRHNEKCYFHPIAVNIDGGHWCGQFKLDKSLFHFKARSSSLRRDMF